MCYTQNQNKIKSKETGHIPISKFTSSSISRRVEDMGYNLLNSSVQKFIYYYSMALDKSADVLDMAQYVFTQGTDESFTIAEEISTSQFEEH